MNSTALVSMLSFSVVLLSVVGGIIWRLSNALNALSLALKQSTLDERERTDRKIGEAINNCRITHTNGLRVVGNQ